MSEAIAIFTVLIQEMDEHGNLTFRAGPSYDDREEAMSCCLELTKDVFDSYVARCDEEFGPDETWATIKEQPSGFAVYDENDLYMGGANYEKCKVYLKGDK